MGTSWRSRLSLRRVSALLGLCGLLLLPCAARAQYTSCNFSPSNVTSTEAWTATDGTVLCGGTYNVQSFDIPSGVTVYVVAGGVVTINATNWIEITGVLNANYAGPAGAGGCTSGTSDRGGTGSGSGGGGGGTSEYYGGYGGGGGAYGCTVTNCGGSGGYPVYDTGSTPGGSPYDSNTSVTQDVGSGGGGGGCSVLYAAGGASGGAGGAGLSLIAPQVQLDAASQILANGSGGTGSSAGGAGGGGSGGNITVSANTILSVSTSAAIEAEGGAGGAAGSVTNGGHSYLGGGGGGGSGGRIKYFGATSCPAVGNVMGGAGGTGVSVSGLTSATGGDGQSGDLTCTALPPLTASASASPSPTTTNTSTTITAVPSNPSGYLLQYEYDCTGTGSSYSAATSSSSTTCSWSTPGTRTVDVKVLGYNAAALLNGTAPGGSLIASYTTSTTVVVGYAPTVSLTVAATGQIAQSISMQGTVSDVSGATGYTYAWTFGDGSNSTTSSTSTTSTVSHVYEAPATYTITLTVTDSNGYTGSASTTIAVADVDPTVTIGPLPSPLYAEATNTFSATATSPSTTASLAGFTYVFNFGDGLSTTINPSASNGGGVSTTHSYAAPGTYELQVTATDDNGGIGSQLAMVTVTDPIPSVSLNAVSYTVAIGTALPVTGTASSSYAPAQAAGFTFVYSWGDGSADTTESGESPESASHSYEVPGSYTLKLTVSDDTGVSNSTTATVTVTGAAPTVTIGTLPAPVYATVAATFSASATSPSTTGTQAGFTYVFHWGDGSTNTTLSASPGNAAGVAAGHTYATAGAFSLTVTATDEWGTAGTKTETVTVYTQAPTVGLSLDATSLPFGTALHATGTASASYARDGAGGFQFVFNWGDGTANTTINGLSPEIAPHSYDVPGSYTVQLTVTDATGVANSASQSVTVTDAAPTVTFGPVPSPIYAVTTTATISASASSASAAATVAGFTYVFAWGDGTANTTVGPAGSNGTVTTTHTFPNPGTFTFRVTATDEFNGSGTTTASVTVLDPIPTAAFGAATYTGSAGSAVSFTAIASSPLATENSGSFTWSFDWGDGNSSGTSMTGTSPAVTTHVYDLGGTYTATVTVKDSAGTSSQTATTSVTIGNVAPTITEFLHPNGSFGSPITFSAAVTDASTADTAAGFHIVWNFGDGTPAQSGKNLDTVTHTYAAPATYTVTVTATDENNLQATATGTTVVADTAPLVSLDGNQTIQHSAAITLTPTITPYDAAWTYTYAWNLGDGTTASTPTVTKSYSALGMYTVSLTVTDPFGGSGSTSVVITVIDTPPVASNLAILPVNPGPQQALTLSYTYTDANNDPESGTTIVWYLNSQAAAAYNNLLTIPASAVQRNQEWFAVVTPNDGYLFGAAVTSNTVIIGDPPPVALDVALSPAEPEHADTLMLSYTYSDAYGYSESGTTIAWTKNGIAQPTLANQHSAPPPLTKGDVWQATVTPSDGFAVGAGVASNTVTVQNTPPVLGPLPNIAEPAQMLLTSVSWTVSGTDVDNDPLTFDCAVGSTDLGPGPAYTAAFPIGTTLVSCSVSDGTATVTGTFQVAIGDVPPVVMVPPNQTINPGAVTLTATGQDPVGRAITYQWSVLSSPVSIALSGAETPSVAFTAFVAGDYVLECTVSNGVEQASAQTTVTVMQLAPLVNLGPGPRTMVADETITLDGAHSVDPNGGTLTYQWAVTSGVVQLSSTTSPTVNVTASFGGRATVSLTVNDGVQSATGSITINIWNGSAGGGAPVSAVVGPDQTVLAGSQVTLDGTASFDPNARVLSEAWKQVSGPPVTLSQATTALPQFLAQTAGTYVFELTVIDGALTSTATSTVTALPSMGDQLPVAVATPSDSTVQLGGSTTVDGTSSTASAGHPLTYQWTRLSGPYVLLTGATQSVCEVTPYGEGEVVLQLVVNDGTFSSLPVLATVHATEGTMAAPTATATASSPALAGLPVTLDGSGSRDPNGLPLVYQWQQLTGAPAEILGSETATASFVPSTSGPMSFQLTVSDWIFGASTQVVVSVQADDVPVAVAKAPPSGYAGDTLALDGTESHDPAGRPLSFAWKQVGGPTVALQNSSSMSPTFLPESKGTYVFQLKVSNGQFTSPPVTVTTQVQDYPTLRGGGCTSPTGADWMGVLSLFVALPLRRRTSRGRR